MKSRNFDRCFSAYVSLALYAEGQAFDLAKVGPERVFVRDENAGPRGPATLFITIGRTTKLSPIVIDETRCDGREIGYIDGATVIATM